MRTKTLLLVLAALFAASPALAQGTDSSIPKVTEGQIRAAEKLLQVMNLEAGFNDMVNMSIERQTTDNAQLKKYEPVLREFMSRYLTWSAMSASMTALYAREFTEKELKDITSFCVTPAGRKTITRMPALLQEGIQIVQQQLQPHLPELEQMISEYDRHLNDSKEED